MTLAFIHSRARLGLQAPPVTIEVHLSNGLPGFQLVGLAETTVREARDRVRSALRTRSRASRTVVSASPTS